MDDSELVIECFYNSYDYMNELHLHSINGFQYISDGDYIECTYCGFIITNLNNEYNPFHVHNIRNPSCPFLLFNSSSSSSSISSSNQSNRSTPDSPIVPSFSQASQN
uniref:Uncharacterized protein n=1 Tax=Tetranychus urticae TaxID=32264 RepID=T1KME1_TETUR